MKLRVLLFIVFITKIVFSQVTVLKVKSFRCTASNKSVSPDYKCAAKSWSRVESGVSFTFNYTRRCYNTKVSLASNFKELFWCNYRLRLALISNIAKRRPFSSPSSIQHWTCASFSTGPITVSSRSGTSVNLVHHCRNICFILARILELYLPLIFPSTHHKFSCQSFSRALTSPISDSTMTLTTTLWQWSTSRFLWPSIWVRNTRIEFHGLIKSNSTFVITFVSNNTLE